MALLSDQTWSFDASPDYSEFSSLHGGLNHTSAEVFVLDSTIKRHGTRSCHLTQFANSINPFNSASLDSRVLTSSGVGDTAGSQAWYAFSYLFPTGQPAGNGWNATMQFEGAGSTHPSYGPWSLEILPGGTQLHLRWRSGHCPSPGASDFNPTPPNGYNADVPLLGTGAPRPLTHGVWHDFYFYVDWQATTNGIFELYHREENGAWAKLYSNLNNGTALINVAPHPTMQYNDAYGSPGQNGTSPYHIEWGFYTNATAGASNFWMDGLRRRQSEADILVDFPGGAGTGPPPNPATGRFRLGNTAFISLAGLTPDLKRVNRHDTVPAGATVDIYTFYAYLKGPVSGGPHKFRAVVYAHEGTDPAARFGVSDEIQLINGQAAGWVNLPIASPIRATGPLGLGFISDAGTGGQSESGVQAVTGSSWFNANLYSNGASSPFGSFSLGDYQYSVCADYLIVADTVAPTISTASIIAAGVVLTFSEALDPASIPVESAFTVRVEGVARGLNDDLTVSGANVTFSLTGAVNLGDVVQFDYVAPSIGKLRDFSLNNVANITAASISNLTNPPISTLQRLSGTGLAGTSISGTRISGTRIS